MESLPDTGRCPRSDPSIMILIMSAFEPSQYGPVFAPLLSGDRRRPLDAGRPNKAALAALEKLSVESAFAHTHVVDRQMAECCRAGVWLLHDYLDESHRISQNIETNSGSFWHAIMHRREGDFSNAKYWYARCREHPVRKTVGDANAFVDLVSRVHDKLDDPRFAEAVRTQKAEWQALFEYCLREAVG